MKKRRIKRRKVIEKEKRKRKKKKEPVLQAQPLERDSQLLPQLQCFSHPIPCLLHSHSTPLQLNS